MTSNPKAGPRSETLWSSLERSVVFKALVIAVYLGSNISLNMLNKWTLSLYGFRFPMLMGLAHMLFSFLALGPVMCLKPFRELHMGTLSKQWGGLLMIGTLFALNVGLNNASLVSIPLSLNQVIRASIPVVAAVGSIFIESKTPSPRELLALGFLVLGVGIAVWEGSSTSASVFGVIICLLGTVSNGLMMSSIGKLVSEKLDVLRLTFYTAPLTCVMLLPFFYGMEAEKFGEYQRTHSASYLGLLLLGCINALCYNLVHSYVIKITSAVTTTVIGEMKIVLILLLSSLMLGESSIWTLKMLVGCTTAILGFCMYSHAKLGAPPAKPLIIKAVPELPSLGTDTALQHSSSGGGSQSPAHSSLKTPLLGR